MPRALMALALLVLALVPAAAMAKPAASKPVSVAAARALPLGTVVTVQGSVTTPSGVFSSSTFDQGFAVQDATGGIYVSVTTDLGVSPRQQVRVTGSLTDLFGQRILVIDGPAAVTKLGTGPKIAPRPLATGAVGEATEGLLVTITGTITDIANDLPYGYRVNINDGSGETRLFISASTGIDLSGWAVGQQLRATGLSSQFDTQYEVLPRGPGDVQVE